MKTITVKTLCLATFLLSAVGTAAAQVPPHGTVPATSAMSYIQQGAQYSTPNPNANFLFGISLQNSAGAPPYDLQYLEITAPNSAPMTINVLTNTNCAPQNSPSSASIYECQVQYPLSTADMINSSVIVTARHYATKNAGATEIYHRKTQSINGTAGSIGTTSGGGGSTPIPPVSPIPPHSSVTADTPYQISVSSSLANYSPTNNIIPINLVITPNSPPTSLSLPFGNELVEIKSPNGAVKTLHIPSHCTRSGFNNMTLTCNTTYVLPASDASQPNLLFEGRYFANDYLNNTLIVWTGYSRGSTLLQGTTTGGGFTGTNCPPETNPMMPTNTNSNINGSVFTFTQNTADVCGSTFWIDPPIAIGYSYAVEGGEFESVKLPGLQTVADSNGYTLHYNLGGWQTVPVMAGDQHVFPSPVAQYQVKGIDPSIGLNLHDPAAFAMGIKLTNPSGSQVKITQVPMPLGTGVVIERDIFKDRADKVLKKREKKKVIESPLKRLQKR